MTTEFFFEVAEELDGKDIGEWEGDRDRGAKRRLGTVQENRRGILVIPGGACTELSKDRGVKNDIWAKVGGGKVVTMSWERRPLGFKVKEYLPTPFLVKRPLTAGGETASA